MLTKVDAVAGDRRARRAVDDREHPVLQYRDVHPQQFPGTPVVENPFQATLLVEALLRALRGR